MSSFTDRKVIAVLVHAAWADGSSWSKVAGELLRSRPCPPSLQRDVVFLDGHVCTLGQALGRRARKLDDVADEMRRASASAPQPWSRSRRLAAVSDQGACLDRILPLSGQRAQISRCDRSCRSQARSSRRWC